MTSSEMRQIAKLVAQELKALIDNGHDFSKDRLLEAREAAELLHLSQSGFAHMAKEFPRKRVGKKYLYSYNALRKWMM